MAEELDGTQKPKVELIKHPKAPNVQPEQDQARVSGTSVVSGQSGETAEHGEKKKVVVVKKKTPPLSGGQFGESQGSPHEGAPNLAKRPQPKVVVVPSAAQQGKEQVLESDTAFKEDREQIPAVHKEEGTLP